MQSQICKKAALAEGFYYRPLIAQIARKNLTRNIFYGFTAARYESAACDGGRFISPEESLYREEREGALATPVLAVRREHTSDSEVCSAISAPRRAQNIKLLSLSGFITSH